MAEISIDGLRFKAGEPFYKITAMPIEDTNEVQLVCYPHSFSHSQLLDALNGQLDDHQDVHRWRMTSEGAKQLSLLLQKVSQDKSQ